jgi:hypothetical protein
MPNGRSSSRRDGTFKMQARLNPRKQLAVGAIVAMAVVASALLTNRTLVVLTLGTNPAGEVAAFARLRWGYLVPFVAGIACLVLDPSVLRKVRASRWWWVPFAVIASDLTVAIITGAVRHSWVAGIAAVLPSLAALGALCAGVTLVTWDRRIIDWAVAAGALICAASGIEQMMRRNDYLVPFVGTWLARFDSYAVGITGGLQFDRLRAEGLDVNPNNFAFLGLMACIWALFGMRKGALRTTAITASLLVIVLGQARTIILALLAVGLVALVDLIRRRTTVAEIARIVGMVAIIVAIVVISAAALFGRTSLVTYVGRVSSAAAVASKGSSADPSLRGRIRVWKRALPLIAKQPQGYYSAAGLKLGGALDNESLWRLIIGGWLYFFVFVGLLVWLVFALRPPPSPLIGTAYAAVLAITGLTMVPSQILGFMVLGWFCIGAAMLLGDSQSEAGVTPFSQ